MVVVVVRSGGIAGLSRQWRAEPDPDREPHWRDLVDRCPWDAPVPPTRGADRFRWRIEVIEGESAVRHAELGDGQVDGPWRILVDEVRRSARSEPPRR